MIKNCAVGLLAGMLFVATGLAQNDAHALAKILKGRQMALRSYSADPVASYTWANGALASGPIKLHTVAIFTTRSVKLQGDVIAIEGTRATLAHNAKTDQVEPSGKSPMKLEIDIGGTDPKLVLPKLEQMLFFPDTTSAITNLPMPVTEMLSLVANQAAPGQGRAAYVYDGANWIVLHRPFTNYVAPKVVYSAEPQYAAEARRKKVNGSVSLLLYISDTGKIGDIWLRKPLGFGLDESAEDAARQYVFKPAMYSGKPAGTELRIDVSFEVF